MGRKTNRGVTLRCELRRAKTAAATTPPRRSHSQSSGIFLFTSSPAPHPAPLRETARHRCTALIKVSASDANTKGSRLNHLLVPSEQPSPLVFTGRGVPKSRQNSARPVLYTPEPESEHVLYFTRLMVLIAFVIQRTRRLFSSLLSFLPDVLRSSILFRQIF